MSRTHLHCRVPRAGLDPIDDPTTAARILSAVVRRPLRSETIVVLLDAERRGIGVVVVAGTDDPDAVVEVVEFLSAPGAHEGRVGAVIVATIRPDADAPDDRDVDRWMEISSIASDQGVEVIEWFVVGPERITCPRDHLGEPPRW